MSKKKVLWIVLPVLILVGAGAAAAGYKQHRGHHNPERMVERISESLELNAEQQLKLDAVKQALVESKQEMSRERVDTLNQLIEEVRKPQLDQARVMGMFDQRKARIEELAPRVLAPIIEFHQSLDDAQRGKIVNLLETFRDWGRGHHGHG